MPILEVKGAHKNLAFAHERGAIRAECFTVMRLAFGLAVDALAVTVGVNKSKR